MFLKSQKKKKIFIFLLLIVTSCYFLTLTKQPIEQEKYVDSLHFDVLTDYDNLKSLNNVLKETIDVFHRNNLTYWITGGTLLGAVRDKGTVPWDDDADIAITADSLNQFKSLFTQFNQLNITVLQSNFFYKLFYIDGRETYNFKYPFIDVFVYHQSAKTLL